MAQLAIAAAGAVIGSAIAPGIGTSIGWALGSMVGAQFGPKQKSYGPRLEDLRVTGSEYGQTIPWVAGHPRVAGQVWWASKRREISTTTSAGKGGGGAESTTYTYEVDILYGLVNRSITAVSRVWLNGKLVWTAHVDADDDSVINSNKVPEWERMTVHTGAATQMPDPVYEAAVGAGNAPAYRGRGSVFIQGLQLGNSGVIPNLTFEVVIDGDLTSVGATRLQSYFDDNDSTDISGYGGGAGTLVGASISGNKLVVNHNTVGDQSLTYESANIAADGVSPITIEAIIDWQSTPNVSYMRVLNYVPNINFGDRFSIGYYGADGKICYDDLGFGTQHVSAANYTGPTHVAIVVAATGLRVYFAGALVYQTFGDARPSSAVAGRITLGDPFGYNSATATAYTISEFAIRFEEKFTGASFTPPTEIDPPSNYVTVDPDDDTLENVVDDLCAGAGMPSGSYDASALASITKPVRAFVLSQVATTRSALEQLASAYFFESYATDKLYFVPRAGSPVGSVDADDLGTGIDAPADDALPTDVGSDMEIPAQVSLSYANADADYTTATELSVRLLSGQVSTRTTQIPLAFTAAEAKGIADAIVMDGYASRVTGSFAVPMKYAALVPTDVVTVQDPDGNTYRVRIVRRTDSGPVLSFEWGLDDATVVQSAGITSSDYTPTVNVALPGETLMELLDIPLLRDDENKLGHYVAASSPATTWPGASISRSSDDVEFVEAARVNERAIFGAATTALGNWTGGKVFDETNTVTVSLSYGTLSSSTRSAMLADAGVNVMLVGGEVIRFRAATYVSAGVYTLSGLLRGQRGTEWAMSGHVAGDRVVLLRTAGLRYVAIDLPSLAAARYYKGVTIGKSLASVDSEAFTCNGVSLKPLAPVNIRRTVGTGNQITLTWSRRTRLACTFVGAAGISVPLGEAAEAYEVDVVLVSGNVLKRTLSAGSASEIGR